MSILQRIVDALTLPPPPPSPRDPLPPPDGTVRMLQALRELESSSAELRQALGRPTPADTLREARREHERVSQ